MNFQQLQLDVLARLDETGNTDLQSSVKTWVNQTYKDICNRYDFDFLQATGTISTASGTSSYPIANAVTNLKKVYDVSYSDGSTNTRIPLTTPDVFEKEHNAETRTETGTPDHYYIWNGNLYLYPIPDYSGTDNLTVRYYNYPADMNNDGEIPIIPEPYHELIVVGACVKARQYNDEPTPEAAQLRQQYEEGIIRMINDLSDTEGTEENPNIEFIY